MTRIQQDVKTDNTGRRTSILVAVLLFLAVIAVAAFTYMKSQGIELSSLDPGRLLRGSGAIRTKAAESVGRIQYDPKEHSVYLAYKEYLAKCNMDGVKLLDLKGREVWADGLSLDKPLLLTNGAELLVADIGGMNICVVKDRGVLWKDRTDAAIINAEINAEGYVTVITENEKYNSEIRVYDQNGIEQFKTYIANDFAVSAEISSRFGQMAVNTIDTGGAEAFTHLKFLDMEGAVIGEKDLEAGGNIYPLMWYTGDGSIFLAGDKSIAFLDRKRELKWDKAFSGVTGAHPAGSNRIAVAAEGARGGELSILAENGQEVSSSPVDGRITGMASDNGIISVITADRVLFFNEGGKYLSTCNAGSEILDVCAFNRHQAAVITKGNIEIVNI